MKASMKNLLPVFLLLCGMMPFPSAVANLGADDSDSSDPAFAEGKKAVSYTHLTLPTILRV